MQPWITSGDLPATFSDFWLTDILRGELGFGGLIITDALEMRALTNHFNCGQIALGAFLAGADILLIPSDAEEAFKALLHGYETGLFGEERLNESVLRILRAKNTAGLL
jgi:beta-N-acetylhexosaminidase